MLILVFGSNGWIGKQFIEVLKKNKINFICGNSRINNLQDIKKEINSTSPTHIVSFIGRTHGTIDDKKYTTIDYLEQEGKLFENIRDNLYSPFVLSELCNKLKIHYTYLHISILTTQVLVQRKRMVNIIMFLIFH